MASFPTQAVLPRHPSLMTYVCTGQLRGTVNCTCAQILPFNMHAGGGRLPEPVSSYTTSTPAALKMRITVLPLHTALT